MAEKSIKITLDELKELVNDMENQIKYQSMRPVVYVSIEHHPNGRAYLQFEQPCNYAECFSHYRRYDAK